jgi:hypothetical protein
MSNWCVLIASKVTTFNSTSQEGTDAHEVAVQEPGLVF